MIHSNNKNVKKWNRYSYNQPFSKQCVKEAIEKIYEYFSINEQENILIASFLLFIGMSSRTFYKFRSGLHNFPEELVDALEFALLNLELKYERNLSSKFSTGAIFALKCQFNWNDNNQNVINNNNNFDLSSLTDEQLDRLISKFDGK